jgi:hypothetical protein
MQSSIFGAPEQATGPSQEEVNLWQGCHEIAERSSIQFPANDSLGDSKTTALRAFYAPFKVGGAIR